MTSAFGNWSMPYWSGLASAQRSAPQLYQDWLRGQQLATNNSPLNQVRELTSSDLSGLSTNPYYSDSGGGAGESTTANTNSIGVGSVSPGVASAIGQGVSMAGKMAGMPASVSGVMGGAISGVASGRGALNGAANSAIGLGLNALGPIGTLAGIAMGLFGVNPMDSILNSFDLPGLQDFGTPLGQMASKASMNSLNDDTTAQASAASYAHSHTETSYGDLGNPDGLSGGLSGFSGGYEGMDTETSYGDLGGQGGYGGDPSSAGADGDGSGGGGTGSNGGEGGAGTGGEDGGSSDGNSWAHGGLVQYRRGCRC